MSYVTAMTDGLTLETELDNLNTSTQPIVVGVGEGRSGSNAMCKIVIYGKYTSFFGFCRLSNKISSDSTRIYELEMFWLLGRTI